MHNGLASCAYLSGTSVCIGCFVRDVLWRVRNIQVVLFVASTRGFATSLLHALPAVQTRNTWHPNVIPIANKRSSNPLPVLHLVCV